MRSTIIFRIIINSIVFLLFAYIFPQGLHLRSFQFAILAAFLMAFVDQLVKPIIQLLSLPITVLTLWLFSFVINILVLMAAGYLIKGFSLSGLAWNVTLSIILSISNTWLQSTSKTRLF